MELLARFSAIACVAVAFSAQAEQPQGGWLADARTGCKVRDTVARPNTAVHWTGGCSGGLASGQGTAVWLTKGQPATRYEGAMDEGSPHGKGVVSWSDGQRYEGNWVRGLQEGHGAYTYANGDVYEGDFLRGARDGRGAIRFGNGDRYDGELRDGEPDGRGKYVTAQGDIYEGGYRRGVPQGEGTARVGGAVYAGTWSGGCFHKGSRYMTWGPTAAECGFPPQ